MKREDVKNLLISETLRVTGMDFIDADESILLNYREIDSLDSVEILMGCEHRLGIDLNFDDFDQVKTFGDAIDTLFAIVENLDCPKPKPQKSIINWQTGIPKESGEYLVSLEDGFVCRDKWREPCYDNDIAYWENNEGKVIAWCMLIDIKPYKEE